MDINIVQTDRAPAAIGPYSQGIAAGSWLFVSGQLGLDPETGEMSGPDFASQARRALENLEQIVLSANCEMKAVTAVDVFLTDMQNFAVFNEIYAEFFDQHRPARAVVEVRALPRGAQVEVKCIAFRVHP